MVIFEFLIASMLKHTCSLFRVCEITDHIHVMCVHFHRMNGSCFEEKQGLSLKKGAPRVFPPRIAYCGLQTILNKQALH